MDAATPDSRWERRRGCRGGPRLRAALIVSVVMWGVHGSQVGFDTLWAWTGLALLGVGLLGLWWSAATLRNAGADWPQMEPPRLVDEGPYRWLRHPMTASVSLILLGSVVATRSVWGAVFAAIWLILTWTLRLPREESELAHRYGGWWRDHAERVGSCGPRCRRS